MQPHAGRIAAEKLDACRLELRLNGGQGLTVRAGYLPRLDEANTTARVELSMAGKNVWCWFPERLDCWAGDFLGGWNFGILGDRDLIRLREAGLAALDRPRS
jgi:hypothetical protein